MAVQGPDLGGEDLLAIANLRILFLPNIFSTLYRKFLALLMPPTLVQAVRELRYDKGAIALRL